MIKVLVGGSFDLITTGHIYLLRFCKGLGDYLIVNVENDDRVRRKKGDTRPIQPLDDRMQILRGIRWVDRVDFLPIPPPLRIDYIEKQLDYYAPDIFVCNPETEEMKIEIMNMCRNRNIDYIPAPTFESESHTSDLINKIVGNYNRKKSPT